MNKKIKFFKIIKIWGFIFLISIMLIFASINFYFYYHNFQNHKKEIRKNYIKQQKNMIKRQVLQVIDRIDYERLRIENITKNKIKKRVYEAYAISENIYQNNKNKTKKQIQKMIVDALRPIRFNDGRGYYFMTDLNGYELLFADKPQMEGKNLINFQDTKGNLVVKKMIEIVKKNKEGFYSYYWTKPNSMGNDFKKISFVKYFKPLNCFIGSGLYVDDVEKSIQERLLNNLSRIRFGENGYIFVNTFDGYALVSNGKRFSGDKKLWELFNKNPKEIKSIFEKELTAAKKPAGDYIYYKFIKLKNNKEKSPKASFIKGIPKWKWVIGSGVYLDDVDAEIGKMQADFLKKILKASLIIFIIIIIILILSAKVFSNFTKKIRNDFNILVNFLKRANKSNEPIERSKIIFDELDIIAKNANEMLSDKIKAETELANEKELLFVTIKSIGDGVITTDTEGKITLMNAVAENLTGYKTEEAKGKNLEEVFRIFNSQTGEAIDNPVSKVLKNGQIVGLANHTKLISKKGYEYQISDSASPIRDKENKILGVVLVFRDVTNEYYLKNQIEKTELQFKTVIEQSPISTQIFDVNGLTISANKAWENLWNAPANKIIGRYNAFEDQSLKGSEWMKLFKKAFEGETVLLPDLEYDPKESGELGRKRIIKCVAFPIKNNKNVVQMVVLTHQDVTDLKEYEERMMMMSKLKSIGTLAGGIAHDFNNILTGIFGNISLAKMYSSKDSKVKKYLENAEISMNRAVRLTKQLLIFSKGGSPVKENISIKEIVKEVAKFDLSGSNVKPIFDIQENLWNIKADKGHIQQVFSNLVINANQAMPNGGNIYFMLKNIEIKSENLSGLNPGKYVKIIVRDEGVGIEKENLKKIFDPYFTTKSTGNGLGLATTYSIIEKHNGHIEIESEVGKGTNFTIFLPATEGKIEKVHKKNEEKHSLRKSAKILIMDDEKMICNLAVDMIKTMGFEAEVSYDGRDAIEKYKTALENHKPFDLTIMDLTIPGGMGGKEAITHILKINPNAKVIVSSGYSSGKTLANYKDLGFEDIIAKPYTIEKLQKKINEILGDLR